MVAIKDIEMPKSCGGCNCSGIGVCKEWVYLNGYDLGKKRADTCPLVETEELKTGEWIEERDDYGELTGWHCSNCYDKTGFVTTCAWDYCPKCGSKNILR